MTPVFIYSTNKSLNIRTINMPADAKENQILEILHYLDHQTRNINARLDTIEQHMKYAEQVMVTKEDIKHK